MGCRASSSTHATSSCQHGEPCRRRNRRRRKAHVNVDVDGRPDDVLPAGGVEPLFAQVLARPLLRARGNLLATVGSSQEDSLPRGGPESSSPAPSQPCRPSLPI